MGSLILAGLLAQRYGAQRVMKVAAVAVCITCYPLMVLIQSADWMHIVIAKIIFTILTAAFIGPFHSWAQSISNTHNRYKNISISYAMGKCFSTILLACSFLIYNHFKNIT
jgi:MFS family permease